MLSITDATLSAINPSATEENSIRKLYQSLLAAGIDYVEVSPAILSILGKVMDPDRTIIRREFFLSHGKNKIAEITANTFFANHGNIPEPYCQYDSLRIISGESLLDSNFFYSFGKIRNFTSLPVSFCAKNASHAAVPLTVEWILSGGEQIVCSLMGVGGYAPLEEVQQALQANISGPSKLDVSQMELLGSLCRKLTGFSLSAKKTALRGTATYSAVPLQILEKIV